MHLAYLWGVAVNVSLEIQLDSTRSRRLPGTDTYEWGIVRAASRLGFRTARVRGQLKGSGVIHAAPRVAVIRDKHWVLGYCVTPNKRYWVAECRKWYKVVVIHLVANRHVRCQVDNQWEYSTPDLLKF